MAQSMEEIYGHLPLETLIGIQRVFCADAIALKNEKNDMRLTDAQHAEATRQFDGVMVKVNEMGRLIDLRDGTIRV